MINNGIIKNTTYKVNISLKFNIINMDYFSNVKKLFRIN